MSSVKALTFKVTRRSPELIPPAKPTPHEFKPLSDIDDQDGLRSQIPVIQFYRRSPAMDGVDPVVVIRQAIAKALVFYYPFAGRLREGAARKLVVECTGEGVLFIEADADVTLQEFGELQPPFPCLEELLYDVPGSAGIINCPMLLIQVTRLKCDGFIVAIRLNHTMSDGAGLVQFMATVGELARGADAPSIPPVWKRELLSARDPPFVSFTHHGYDEVSNTKGTPIPLGNMVHRSFFFGAAEISALRRHMPPRLHNCSTFELLTACVWRCRTIATPLDPNEEIRILCVVNARRCFNPPLPVGYYGNVIAHSAAITTFEKLSKNPVHYAVDLVRKAKSAITEEYMMSLVNLMVIKGRPHYTMERSFLVSDATRGGRVLVDFGWGKPVYNGPAKGTVACFHILVTDNKGEKGIVIPIYLATNAMEVFIKELEMLLKSEDDGMAIPRKKVTFIKSTL